MKQISHLVLFIFALMIAGASAQLVNPGGGGSGGAVTIADGADVAQGTTTDTACSTDNGTCTDLALTKRTNQRLTTINTTLGTPLQAGGTVVASQGTAANLNATVVGTGTFATQAAQSGTWNITNVSGTVSLPTGAATSANQTTWQSATGAAPPTNAAFLGALGGGGSAGVGQIKPVIACDSSITYDASTNGSTELVALISSRIIYVCGYTIFAGGTVNVKLIYGTGTACATSPQPVTPAYQLTAQVGLVDGSPFNRGMKTAVSQALCFNSSAGVAVQAVVYYSQI